MLNWLQIDLTEISAQASNLITYKVAKLITSEIKGYINRLSNERKKTIETINRIVSVGWV